MNQKLRSLTWEYFIEAKIKEIVLTILIIAAIVFIPWLLGHYIGDNQSWWCGELNINDCDNIDQWLEGFVYSVGGIIVIFIISGWLSSNWEKADKKARKELNIMKKK